jgi:hypothetical protein
MALRDITVRHLEDDDLVEVSEWFASRKWPYPPQGAMLPKTGFIAELNGKKLSVAWLYVTNSSVGIVDWIATNPNVGVKGLISIKKLIDHIEDISRESVASYLHFTPNEKLARYLKKNCGFKIAEKGINLCIRTAREAHG